MPNAQQISFRCVRSTNNENLVERNRPACIFFYYGDCGEAYFFCPPTPDTEGF